MKRISFWLIILFLLPFVKLIFADVHIISKATRTYREQTRECTHELWLTEGKSYHKTGFFTYITREDLGVVWRLDLRKKTYGETKLEPNEKPTHAQEDFYTLEFSHNPDYDWSIKETRGTKYINELPCRCFIVEGDADYSEIHATYWICTDAEISGGAEYNRYMLTQLKGDKQRAALFKIMSEYKNSIPLLQDDTVDNPIAREINMKREITKFEIAHPPPGIYELPEGFTNPDKEKTKKESSHAQ